MPMPDKDLGDGPSLELPKLFGRKKDKKRKGGDDAAPEVEPSAEGPSATSAPVEEEPAPAAAPDPAPVDPAEVTMPLPVPAPDPEPVEVPEPEPEPAPSPDPVPEPEPASTAPAPAPAPAPTSAREPETGPPAETTLVEEPLPVPAEGREEAGRRRELTAPSLPSGVAAVLVGALVAVLGIALTWLGLLGCEAVRGTESCGGPGLVVMLAIMAAMVVVGAALLKAFSVPQSGSLSFLGFGILAVVVLTFLLEHLYEPWVLVLLPFISAAGYAVAHWVTTRFDEPDPDFTH